MKKTVFYCDFCSAELINYDPEKDRVQIPEKNSKTTIGIKHDVCLRCLATTVSRFLKLSGEAVGTTFTKSLEKNNVKKK